MLEVCKHGHPLCVHGGCRSHCDECIRALYERMREHPYDSGSDPRGPSNPPPSRIDAADDDAPPPFDRRVLIVRPRHAWWRRAWLWLRGRR